MIKGRTRPGGNYVPDFQGKQKSLELFFKVKVSLIKKEICEDHIKNVSGPSVSWWFTVLDY